MRATIVQSDISWNDPRTNINRYEKILFDAVGKGSDLVVFPEMFTTGFSFLKGEDAVAADQLSTTFLKESAAKFNISIAASLPDTSESKERPRNTVRVFGPTGHLGDYSKIHLFSFAEEEKKYAPGNAPLTITISGVRASFLICYDLRFAQFFAPMAERTDLYVVVANWPKPRQEHWETLLRARAIENQAYVIGVNRVGSGGGLQYGGGSQIISPRGDIMAHLGSAECEVSVEIDPREVESYRADFPAIRDRRCDLYR